MRAKGLFNWSTSLLVVTGLLLLGSSCAFPESSETAPHGEPHASEDASVTPGTPRKLVLYPATSREAPVHVLTDVAVDEDFVEQMGGDWRVKAHRLMNEANSLLSPIGVNVQVTSVQRWTSDDALSSISPRMRDAEQQIQRSPGALFLAITGQDTVRYDGWIETSDSRLIVQLYHDDLGHTRSLIAHEFGHLMGAVHHEDDGECTADGCLMDAAGYAAAITWCDHHRLQIRDTIASRLAAQNSPHRPPATEASAY